MQPKEAHQTISVVVVQYNPQWEKLLPTLHSVIIQENVNLQIVVSDDGSERNLFDKVEKLFRKHGFRNYILLPAEKNEGTVINAKKGIDACSGQYVKCISPGDLLPQKDTLAVWSAHLLKSGYQWSFGEAIYYTPGENNAICPIVREPYPMITDVYLKREETKIRWNYVVWRDVALGAAIFCEKKLYLAYLQRIIGKVIYGEDNIFVMMMFDGIIADYFPQVAIVYEYGEGVSTSGSKIWRERLGRDRKAAEKEMLNGMDKNNPLQKKMGNIVGIPNKYLRYIIKRVQPGWLRFALQRKFKRRYSLSELPENMKGAKLYADD